MRRRLLLSPLFGEYRLPIGGEYNFLLDDALNSVTLLPHETTPIPQIHRLHRSRRNDPAANETFRRRRPEQEIECRFDRHVETWRSAFRRTRQGKHRCPV